ncbi:MAG: pitrilysin family protein [Alistipes sp.]
MITYTQHTLANGLTVVVNRDRTSKLAAVNLLYRVGARNEDPARTGFAHLFEHLMFRGTRRVPNFDLPVQMACGENNAFTNNDYTNFYITLPTTNIETALWLESDRMMGLNITARKLALEKRVVIEEFRQHYLNQPYGDQLMLLRALAYERHPYRWTTIGMTPDHIEQATQVEVRDFYRRYYHPANAILSISSDLDEVQMIALADKWFGGIASAAPETLPPIPQELAQHAARRMEVVRDVPATTLSIAFHMGARTSRGFFIGDFASDLLSGGDSSRLYQRLVRERPLFASINAYITGSVDAGLFIFTGQLLPTTTVEVAEAALWEAIALMQSELASEYEVEKVKNKFEANTLFGELNVMNKAMNLGYYAMLDDLPLINREVATYRSITATEVMDFSRTTFTADNSSTLIYKAKQ